MPYIFIADDDENDRNELCDSLSAIDSSIKVKRFSNGLELMQGLGSVPNYELPSIILLDLRMPIWDGVRTLQALQSDARYSSITPLMWSISDSKSEIDLCIRTGAQEFITKPNNQDEWREAMNTVIRYFKRSLV